MKKFFLACIAMALLVACSEKEPSIIAGHEWNAVNQVVADTSSELASWKPFVVQLDYGKNFDFDSLKCEFIDGKGKVRYSHVTVVNSKMGRYTVQGKKNGAEMTAKDFFHSRESQTVTLRFSTGDRVIAERQIQLVSDK